MDREAIQINLDALVLNKGTLDASVFRKWNFDFPSLSKYNTAMPNALDSEIKTGENDKGIYWHITLPRGLRTSIDGKFPLVPNRWLVIRTAAIQNADETETALPPKAIVIESDCPSDDGTPFLLTPDVEKILTNSADNFRNKFNANIFGTIKQTMLGKVFVYSGWNERAANDVFLTAAENGDVMFSAYCFRNKNVFSYFDSMADIESDCRVKTDYYVVGWLSSDQTAPLYYGSSTDVMWDADGKYDSENDPYFAKYDTAPINVSIGTNVNEAYLALLQQKLTSNTDKITAAVSALLGDYVSDLKKPNANGIAVTHRHTAYFAGTDAAVYFTADTSNGGDAANINLAEINRLCGEIGVLQKSVIAKREQLWLDFWRYHFFDDPSVQMFNFTEKTQSSYSDKLKPEIAVQPLTEDIGKLNEKLNSLDELCKKANGSVKGNYTKRYYKPLSPSIIVSGISSSIDTDSKFNGYQTVDISQLDGSAIPAVLSGNDINLPYGVTAIVNCLMANPKYTVAHKQPYEPIYMEWIASYVNIPFKYWVFDGFRYNLGDGVDIDSLKKIDGNSKLFDGIAPLSGHFQDTLQSRLEKIGESFGKKIEGDLSGFAVLSQDMVGFTEGIAQRDIRPFGKPVKNIDEKDAVTVNGAVMSFSNLLGFDNNNDILSPDWFPALKNDAPNGTPFFGMRSGAFTITDLCVYDKFGRKIIFINSTQETGVYYADNYPLIVGDTMRGIKNYALLPPAFLNQVTLTANMNLICFVTHNTVNESLIIHSETGEYAGEITVISGKPVWVSANTEITPKTKAFIDSVARGCSDRFTQITEQIGISLTAIGGKSDNLLSAVLGRSLALFDVCLAFDFYEEPYRNINWGDSGDCPTYWTYEFPFAVGDPNEREDGYITSFSEDYTSMKSSGDISDCTLGVNNSADFVALCVPGTYFTVRTGVLPAFKFRLPDNYVAASANIAQRIDVNNALIFKNANNEGIFIPAQSDGSDVTFGNFSASFPVTSNMKDDDVPVVSDGVLFRTAKKESK